MIFTNFSINQTFTSFNSPLDQFEVTSLISLNAPVLNYLSISLTNLGFYSILVVCVIFGLHYLGNNENKIIPSKISIAIESLFTTINTMVREQLGKEIYLPFIYSLFMFILITNYLGAVPYSFTVTTSAIVSLGLSLTIWIAVTILGLSIHKLHFFSFFVPSGTPLALVPLLVLIELVSYVARAASLGLRLFANLVAGHTLMKILATFLYKLFSASLLVAVLTLIPFVLFLAIMTLELAINFIQAYVFTILTCSYIKDAIDLH